VLSQKIFNADHLEVTNRYFSFGTNITGADVSGLANAVASAKRRTFGGNLDCDWDVKFYAGTNCLGAIHLNRNVIMVEGVQYNDGTGVVMTFWQTLVTESAPP
jgi:hypothetical protein